MHQWVVTAVALGTLLLAPGIAHPQDLEAGASSLLITAGPQMQVSTMEWRLGSPSAPRSQLTYESARSAGASVSAAYPVMSRGRWSALVTVRGGVSRLLSGRARDSDYSTADRVEYSRSVSQVTGDLLLAADGGIAADRAVRLGTTSGHLHVAGGYARRQVTFRKQHGVQVIPDDVPPDLLRDLNSRYRAQWSGPWIGAGASLVVARGELELEAERHFRTSYSGEGEWNLRTDLRQPVSFVHSARGSGYDVGVGYALAITPHVAITVAARRSTRTAMHGHDLEFPVNGEPTRDHLGAVTTGNWSVQAGVRRGR